jgi:hypothetical protein
MFLEKELDSAEARPLGPVLAGCYRRGLPDAKKDGRDPKKSVTTVDE